jgi:hypothetical protein
MRAGSHLEVATYNGLAENSIAGQTAVTREPRSTHRREASMHSVIEGVPGANYIEEADAGRLTVDREVELSAQS